MADEDIKYTPLYLQVKDIILKRLVEGKYKPGERIPSESVLASDFKISISTVRQALSILVSEGYLEKKQGKGTYVSEKKIKISFMSWVGETKRGLEIIKNVIDKFERKYFSIRIEYIPTTYPKARKDLLQLVSNGKAPDVAQIVSHWTSYFASMGVFEPLDDLLDRDNLKNRFYDKDLLGGVYHNKIYSVSYGLCPMSLIVNKSVLQKLDISLPVLPMTLKQFEDICENIRSRDANIYCYGLCTTNDETDFLRIYTFLQAFGGGFVDRNEKVIFNSKENKEGFKWLKEFVKRNKIFSADIYTIRSEFAKGNIAFITDGPWIRYLINELTGENFDDNFQIVLNPTYKDNNSYSWNYNHALAICSQSKNKFYAAKFIDEITNDYEISNHYYTTVGHLPPNKNYLNEKFYNNDFYSTLKRQLEYSEVLNAQNAMFEKAMVLCQDAVNRILFKDVNIQKELDEKNYYLKMLYYD